MFCFRSHQRSLRILQVTYQLVKRDILTYLTDNMSVLFRQFEDAGEVGHLLVAHAFGFESHSLGVDIYLCALRQHVDLVESIHNVETLGEDSVFLP